MGTPLEPRWLDLEEQQAWLTFATMLVHLPASLDAQLQRDSDINHFEYVVLAGLSMAPDRTLRLSSLAEFTASSLSRLSNVVARLEKRGWVRRTPDPADGRYTLGVLTEAGWKKVGQSAPRHVEEVRRLVFDPLTKNQHRQLRVISKRILHALDPDNRRADDPLRALQATAGCGESPEDEPVGKR